MDSIHPGKLSKGQRTSLRIMDEAQALFAHQGYDGTTLRQIATAAGIQEPGLYNHFAGKQALYEAVLQRALQPMADALAGRMREARDLRDYTDLPGIMTDLLLRHPQMASLFQQALQGDPESTGVRLVQKWLDMLLREGMESLREMGPNGEVDQAALAIHVIALFNLTTGYFLSQRAFETMASGELTDEENIARQKRLLRKVVRAMLIS